MLYSHPLKNLRPPLFEVHENEHCRTGLKTRNFVLMCRSNHRHQRAGIPGGMCIPHPPFNSSTFPAMLRKNAVETSSLHILKDVENKHPWNLYNYQHVPTEKSPTWSPKGICQLSKPLLWGGHRPHHLCLSLRRFAPRRFRWSLRCPNRGGAVETIRTHHFPDQIMVYRDTWKSYQMNTCTVDNVDLNM